MNQHTFKLSGIIFCCLFAFACKPQAEVELQAPIFDNLGDHELAVTTTSELSQRFFNQGLILSYGFNHREAARAFREAARLDSTCAMAYWGLALVLGPNINAPMESTDVEEAFESAERAQQFAIHVSEWEKGLIVALAERYRSKDMDDRPQMDEAYAEAMRKLYHAYPNHNDIATLTAEALMDLHPWDLWQKDGNPQAWTPEIVEIIEGVLKRNPNHPGANHLYIHAVEASFKPEKALASADRLLDLVPGAGHLVHMPSHVYIRTGRYHQGSIANQKAVLADSLYITACNAQGLYPLAYYPHNYHFLAATAALEGRGELAVNAAYQVAAHVDVSLLEEPGYGTLQHYYMIPHYVLVKFAQWDNILALPMPKESLIYPRAVAHYARGMAFAGKGNLNAAKAELIYLRQIAAMPALKEVTIWDINSTDQLMQIATRVLEAELLGRQKKYVRAIELLEEAVAIEDQLNYNEPPDWFFSVRHQLGSVLLNIGQAAKAEEVYRQDLFLYPENGYALRGLYLALVDQTKTEEALQVKQRFEEAWQWAEVELVDSRVNEQTVPSFSLHRSRRTFGGQLPEGLAVFMCTPQGGILYP